MNLADKYISYISSIRRYSDKTVRNYSAVLDGFLRFAFDDVPEKDGLGDSDIISALTPGIIRGYEVYLMDRRKLIPRTVNLHLSVLSGFCRWMIREGLLQSNPVRTVARPKVSKRLPTVFRESDLGHYFRQTDIFASPEILPDPDSFIEKYKSSRPRGYRPEADRLLSEMYLLSAEPDKFAVWLYEKRLRRAITATLYGTGMRRAELVSLNKADVDFRRRIVKVKGKGDKMREIPLTGSLSEEILLYLQAVEMICGSKACGEALFVTAKGQRLYPEFVDRAVKAELTEAGGFSGKKSPHVLRHTLATELLDDGTDLYSIKELLGHSSLAATQVYTHNTIEKLKKVYQTAHPRAKNGGKNGD